MQPTAQQNTKTSRESGRLNWCPYESIRPNPHVSEEVQSHVGLCLGSCLYSLKTRNKNLAVGKMSVSVNFSHPQPRKESRGSADSTQITPSHAVSPCVPQSEAFLSPWMSKWTCPPSTLRPGFHPVMGCLMHFKSSSNQ